MNIKKKKAIIVYSSPAGSTRHVARLMDETLRELEFEVLMQDLGSGADHLLILSELKKANNDTLLFVGSPVYVNHAVPPVMAFLSSLPEHTGVPAVPFVTWGGATSGVALHEMGKTLLVKGFRLAGAAKVMALHSMMWRFENPLGEGRPDASDDRLIRELVIETAGRIPTAEEKQIPLSDLAYLPGPVFDELEKTTLEMMKAHMPERTVDKERCTRCFICANVCPTGALVLSPYPEIDDRCIFCFNCVRECPEDAIVCDLSMFEERIRGRAAQFNEQPPTEIFL